MAPSKKRTRQDSAASDAAQAPVAAAELRVEQKVKVCLGGRTVRDSEPFSVAGVQWRLTASVHYKGQLVLELHSERMSYELPPSSAHSVEWARATATITLQHASAVNGPLTKGPVTLCQQHAFNFGLSHDTRTTGVVAVRVSFSIPAPVQSLDGDVLLSSEGGQAFRMSSLYLRHTSAVMASLFETQTEQLQQAAAAGVPLLVPLKDTAAPHIFLLLQVLYSKRLDALLAEWSLQALQALGALVHQLDLCTAVREAVKTASVSAAPEVKDWVAVELLLWAGRMHFVQLQDRLEDHIVERDSCITLGSCAQNPLAGLLVKFRRRVAELERPSRSPCSPDERIPTPASSAEHGSESSA